MNVILLEKITNLGDIGETAEVKAGFARNYLIPQGKAIPATKENLEQFEQRKSELLAAHKKHVAEAEKRKAKVDGLNIKIEVNASDDGKLYGSVGTKDIADAINSVQAGAEITKAEVLLPHGLLREVGQFQITLDLGYDVTADIALAVVSQDGIGDGEDGSLIEDAEAIDDQEMAQLGLDDTAAVEEDKSGES